MGVEDEKEDDYDSEEDEDDSEEEEEEQVHKHLHIPPNSSLHQPIRPFLNNINGRQEARVVQQMTVAQDQKGYGILPNFKSAFGQNILAL
mmetsp:Transcript_8013/g.5985  ORF Transcript_8013/g.5985 Transcript_8013/m.5985 type:complete len:90 (+) Transcript_8013:526-795(+)